MCYLNGIFEQKQHLLWGLDDRHTEKEAFWHPCLFNVVSLWRWIIISLSSWLFFFSSVAFLLLECGMQSSAWRKPKEKVIISCPSSGPNPTSSWGLKVWTRFTGEIISAVLHKYQGGVTRKCSRVNKAFVSKIPWVIHQPLLLSLINPFT